MIVDQKRIVLTGGPASGKSAVIESLAQRGFFILPENALEIIQEQDQAKTNIFPWTNPVLFQELAANRQFERERDVVQSRMIMDRSIVDCRAYSRHYAIPTPKNALSASTTSLPRYDGVFLLEMLPPPYSEITSNGKPRMTTPKERKRIETLIIEEYEKEGYGLIRVPFMSIQKRVEFILQKSGLA